MPCGLVQPIDTATGSPEAQATLADAAEAGALDFAGDIKLRMASGSLLLV